MKKRSTRRTKSSPKPTARPEGRPTKFDDTILERTEQYIAECEDRMSIVVRGKSRHKFKSVRLPSLEGLARHLRIHKDTVQAWKKEHPGFSVLIGDLLNKQAEALINNGLAGQYNPTITKVLLAKHGYRDVIDTDLTSGGQPIKEEVDYSKLSDDVLRAIAAATSKPE